MKTKVSTADARRITARERRVQREVERAEHAAFRAQWLAELAEEVAKYEQYRREMAEHAVKAGLAAPGARMPWDKGQEDDYGNRVWGRAFCANHEGETFHDVYSIDPPILECCSCGEKHQTSWWPLGDDSAVAAWVKAIEHLRA